MKMDNLQKKFLEEAACDLCGSADRAIIYPSLYRDEDLVKDLSRSFLYAASDRAKGEYCPLPALWVDLHDASRQGHRGDI